MIKYLYNYIDIHKRLKKSGISKKWIAEIKVTNTNCKKPCYMCDFYNECFENVGCENEIKR